MKTDIELMLLAAKAMHHKQVLSFMNFNASPSGDSVCLELGGSPGAITSYWKPMRDDGDALRLAVELGIKIVQYPKISEAHIPFGARAFFEEPHDGDPYAATRRAIVRAAAAIGESL